MQIEDFISSCNVPYEERIKKIVFVFLGIVEVVEMLKSTRSWFLKYLRPITRPSFLWKTFVRQIESNGWQNTWRHFSTIIFTDECYATIDRQDRWSKSLAVTGGKYPYKLQHQQSMWCFGVGL